MWLSFDQFGFCDSLYSYTLFKKCRMWLVIFHNLYVSAMVFDILTFKKWHF